MRLLVESLIRKCYNARPDPDFPYVKKKDGNKLFYKVAVDFVGENRYIPIDWLPLEQLENVLRKGQNIKFQWYSF